MELYILMFENAEYGYSELSDISHYSVKVMCAELLFAEKWPPTKAIDIHFSRKKQLRTHHFHTIMQNIR